MLHTRSSKPCCMIFLLYNLGFTVSSTCKLALSYFLTTVSSISSYKNIGHFSFLATPPQFLFLASLFWGTMGTTLLPIQKIYNPQITFFPFFHLSFLSSLSTCLSPSLFPFISPFFLPFFGSFIYHTLLGHDARGTRGTEVDQTGSLLLICFQSIK